MWGSRVYNLDLEQETVALCSRATRGACLSVLRYLILHANYAPTQWYGTTIERGEIAVSWSTIQQETGLSEKRVRVALKALEKGRTVVRKRSVPGADRTNVYLVVSYELWTTLPKKGRTEGRTVGVKRAAEGRTHTSTISTSDTEPLGDPGIEPIPVSLVHASGGTGPEDQPEAPEPTNGKSAEEKLTALRERYPEVPQIINDRWLHYAPLPQSSRTPSAKLAIATTVLRMHTVEELPWDTVGRIVEHAARVWQPKGMIGSPAALREWTEKKDRRKYEAILAQLTADDSEPARPRDRIDEMIDRRMGNGHHPGN